MQLTYPVYHDNGEVSFCTDEDEPRKEYRKTALVGVAAFTFGMADRHYGGPEEGGWWYDSFKPIRTFYVSKKRADALYLRLMAVRDKLNEGRREIGSILSDGVYAVYPGVEEAYPTERPHYE